MQTIIIAWWLTNVIYPAQLIVNIVAKQTPNCWWVMGTKRPGTAYPWSRFWPEYSDVVAKSWRGANIFEKAIIWLSTQQRRRMSLVLTWLVTWSQGTNASANQPRDSMRIFTASADPSADCFGVFLLGSYRELKSTSSKSLVDVKGSCVCTEAGARWRRVEVGKGFAWTRVPSASPMNADPLMRRRLVWRGLMDAPGIPGLLRSDAAQRAKSRFKSQARGFFGATRCSVRRQDTNDSPPIVSCF